MLDFWGVDFEVFWLVGCFSKDLYTILKETNSSHLKMDGWNISFLWGWPIFKGELLVSGSVYYPEVTPV